MHPNMSRWRAHLTSLVFFLFACSTRAAAQESITPSSSAVPHAPEAEASAPAGLDAAWERYAEERIVVSMPRNAGYSLSDGSGHAVSEGDFLRRYRERAGTSDLDDEIASTRAAHKRDLVRGTAIAAPVGLVVGAGLVALGVVCARASGSGADDGPCGFPLGFGAAGLAIGGYSLAFQSCRIFGGDGCMKMFPESYVLNRKQIAPFVDRYNEALRHDLHLPDKPPRPLAQPRPPATTSPLWLTVPPVLSTEARPPSATTGLLWHRVPEWGESRMGPAQPPPAATVPIYSYRF
jgi:hypothetical protein